MSHKQKYGIQANNSADENNNKSNNNNNIVLKQVKFRCIFSRNRRAQVNSNTYGVRECVCERERWRVRCMWKSEREREICV
jgi:hypothetical protein